mmetsp:Transcript_28719/g.73035  ORF Transcript_28719/g.73035 Transcript_28719/m.73035 type:complete len:287 (-) Transcript_28719:193-1053(-)
MSTRIILLGSPGPCTTSTSMNRSPGTAYPAASAAAALLAAAAVVTAAADTPGPSRLTGRTDAVGAGAGAGAAAGCDGGRCCGCGWEELAGREPVTCMGRPSGLPARAADEPREAAASTVLSPVAMGSTPASTPLTLALLNREPAAEPACTLPGREPAGDPPAAAAACALCCDAGRDPCCDAGLALCCEVGRADCCEVGREPCCDAGCAEVGRALMGLEPGVPGLGDADLSCGAADAGREPGAACSSAAAAASPSSAAASPSSVSCACSSGAGSPSPSAASPSLAAV